MGRGRGHWEERLQEELTTGTVVVGVGNLLRGDDGAGVTIARRLAEGTRLQVFDAGACPENIIGKVCACRPRRVVVVDSVSFDAEPGAIAWFEVEDTEGRGISSHTPSMELFARMVEAETGAGTVVLGIQSGSNVFGAPLCTEVAEAVDEVAEAFEKRADELEEGCDVEKGEVRATASGDSRIDQQILVRLEHGLRAPLCGVQACLRVLEQGLVGEVNDRQKELIERAIMRTGTMLATVSEMVDLSGLPDRVPTEKLRLVGCVELGEWVKATFGDRALAGGLELVVDTESLKFAVLVDEALARRLLSELLENALAYSRSGGSIRMAGRMSESHGCLTIADTGIGIRAADCEEAFREFFRGSNAKAMRSEGTGLGLSIVRRIAAAHGGTVSITSRLESGTTVRICLPCRRGPEEKAAGEPERSCEGK